MSELSVRMFLDTVIQKSERKIDGKQALQTV